MNKIMLSLVTICSVCLTFSANAENKEQEKIPAVITKVIDGDTVKAVVGRELISIRLAGIDCPETRKNEKSDNQIGTFNVQTADDIKILGKKAKKKLKKLLDFKEGEINFQETPEFVCKGETRKVGYLYAGDINVNEYMLKDNTCVPFTCKK